MGQEGTSRPSARFGWLWFAMALLAGASAWTAAAASGPTPLRLILAWQPQAQFAGYYVALERGFYREAGIEATVLAPDDTHSPVQVLGVGEADLAILWLATAVKARADGIPVVNVAQMFRHSSVMLIARASAGIRQLSDLNGRRVSLWPDPIGLPITALMRQHSLQIKAVPQSRSVNLFLRGGVDAMSAMSYNEYRLLLDAGMEPEELTLFLPREYGFDLPEDGLYVLESTWRRDPAAIRAFVAATRRGWKQAFADPEGTLDLLLVQQRAAYIRANRAHERWMLEQVHAAMGETDDWDWSLRCADVERVGETLKQLQIIDVFHNGDARLGCK